MAGILHRPNSIACTRAIATNVRHIPAEERAAALSQTGDVAGNLQFDQFALARAQDVDEVEIAMSIRRRVNES